MSFTKNCPSCGKEQKYKSKGSLKNAIKHNRSCNFCSNKGKNKGKKFSPRSEETKRKISESLKGNKNARGNKGHTHTEETKAKISKALQGHATSEETRIKISIANGGNGVLNENKFHIYKLGKWSKDVRNRDNNVCCCCGSSEELHAHHIFYKGIFPELSYVLNNGVTLCRPCHELEHKINRNIFNGGFDGS